MAFLSDDTRKAIRARWAIIRTVLLDAAATLILLGISRAILWFSQWLWVTPEDPSLLESFLHVADRGVIYLAVLLFFRFSWIDAKKAWKDYEDQNSDSH